MTNVELYLLIIQGELILAILLIIYHMMSEERRKQKKIDPLLKHVKEYLAEGYTFGQVKEKLKKIGFEKERIDKVMTAFLRH